jgi:hypothetical protein
MKKKMIHRLGELALLALSTLSPQCSTVHAQGTAFTYQGRLNSSGGPANGSYDLEFTLYATNVTGTALAGPVTNAAVMVTNGLFTAAVDFGEGVFAGGNDWLQIALSTNGANSFSLVSPRQQLTPTPYAIFAITASNLSGTVSAAQISGAVADGNLPASPTVSGTVTASFFSGNGSNVTNVNAAALNGLNATNFWQLGGNNVAAGQILGSTNSQPLEIRVAGVRVGLFSPSAGNPDIVFGGLQNVISNGTGAASILGGSNNTIGATCDYSVIGGGSYGSIQTNAYDSFLGGGSGDTIQANAAFSVLGGGLDNTIESGSYESFLGGGAANTIEADAGQSVLGGGLDNNIQTNAYDSFLGGGYDDTIGAGAAFTVLGGGYVNTVQADAYYSFLGGGTENSIETNSQQCVIDGGSYNTILTNVDGGSIGGGSFNQVSASGGTVPGGFNNLAAGIQSFAAGNYAQAMYDGDFVWADSQDATFTSTATNQFLVRASGGVGIGATNSIGGAALTIRYPQGAPTNSMPSQDNGLGLGQFGVSGYKWIQSYGGALTLNPLGNNVGIDTTNPVHLFQVGNAYCDGNQWYPSSDRNVKSGFQTISPQAVLSKVAALPITRWHYTNDVTTTHLGPMAQDFYAAFQVGPDDRHISTLDEGSVALAAIQGLNQKVEDKDAEIADLKSRLEKVEQLMTEKIGGAK